MDYESSTIIARFNATFDEQLTVRSGTIERFGQRGLVVLWPKVTIKCDDGENIFESVYFEVGSQRHAAEAKILEAYKECRGRWGRPGKK